MVHGEDHPVSGIDLGAARPSPGASARVSRMSETSERMRGSAGSGTAAAGSQQNGLADKGDLAQGHGSDFLRLLQAKSFRPSR
jgi:hypothetical protein